MQSRSLRADKKVAKYGPLAAGVSSQFRAAVIERFGACCDSLVGFISMLCGDGLRVTRCELKTLLSRRPRARRTWHRF